MDGKEKEVNYYVRFLPESGREVQYHMPNLGDELERKNLLTWITLGNEYILCSQVEDCFEVGMQMLEKNEFAFLKQNPYHLVFPKFPFFIGVNKNPSNQGLPLELPFTLKIEKGLIVKSNTGGEYLDEAYKLGSLVSTNLGQGSFGVRRADDALKYLLAICEKPLSETSFLEIGCADGYLLHRLKGAKQLLGCEPGPMALEGSRKFKINIIHDFFKPGLVKDKQDIVFSYGVLEHIAEPLEFLELQRKVLHAEGKIFVAVPNCEEKLKMGDVNFLGHEHFNYFTKASLKNLLVGAGLSGVRTVVGKNKAMIYGWGRNSNQQGLAKHSDEELFFAYCGKVRGAIKLLQERLSMLEQKGKSIGLYGGGHNLLGVLENKTEPRFFNGDVAKQGHYYPGYQNAIEIPDNLLTKPVDEIWIVPIDYDEEITNYLQNELKVTSGIFSLKNFLEGLSCTN